jgi:uncharacterized protein (DUF2236 family)
MEDTNSLISREHMERLWSSVRDETSSPDEGIFGQSALFWKVNREAALFLGAERAALLHLAHPWVAASLDQHSNLRRDPLARFHNTFRIVFTMIFGTLEQALEASRHLYALHTRIQGRLPATVDAYAQGSHYRANELNALTWVYATLVESALLAYDSVLPSLSMDEREIYYAESKRLAMLCGIPAYALPPDWTRFEAFNRSMWMSDKLGVNSLARELANRLLHGQGSQVPIPSWYRILTTAWLPERIRVEFELEYGQREREAMAKTLNLLPRIYHRLPVLLRFVGPYFEARARLLSRHVGPLIGLSNRFWMGQARMMFSELEH